jgi:ketosteroid isomerase-like protein
VPKEGNASFHSPRGDSVFGADAVADRFRRDAAGFARGGNSRFEIMQKEMSGDLAFWTGFQIAVVRMRGQDQPREMRIRLTEAFRRIDGAWMLTHRHADLVSH